MRVHRGLWAGKDVSVRPSTSCVNLSEQAHLELSLGRVHAVPPFSMEVGNGVERLGWEVGTRELLARTGWRLARVRPAQHVLRSS